MAFQQVFPKCRATLRDKQDTIKAFMSTSDSSTRVHKIAFVGLEGVNIDSIDHIDFKRRSFISSSVCESFSNVKLSWKQARDLRPIVLFNWVARAIGEAFRFSFCVACRGI
jgi:hypothetical protein